MLARAESVLPRGPGWLYEPKWDGFRALLYRDADRVHLMSRNGRPLTDSFPEIVRAAQATLPTRVVLDGELVVCDAAGVLDFEALLHRLHPRRDIYRSTASFIPFYLLATLFLHDALPINRKSVV